MTDFSERTLLEDADVTPVRRSDRRVFPLLLLAIALVLDAIAIRTLVRKPWLEDFGRIYASADAWRHHEPMYSIVEIDPLTQGPVSPSLRTHPVVDRNLNPPHLALLVAPLTWLPPRAAVWVWIVGGLVCAYASTRIVMPIGGIDPTVYRTVLLASAPTIMTLATGQIALLLSLPATLAWRALRDRRWTSSALWWGLLVSVKPFLSVVLIAFVLARQWRAVAIAVATAAAALGAGLLAGLENVSAWLSMLELVSWSARGTNASWRGLLERLLTHENPDYQPMTIAPDWVVPLWASLAIATCVIGAWAVWRVRRDPDAVVGLLLIGALLLSPLGWIYYWWLALGPLTLAVARGWQARTWSNELAVLVLLGLVWPPTALTIGQPSAILTLTVGSVFCWTSLAWGVLLIKTAE